MTIDMHNVFIFFCVCLGDGMDYCAVVSSLIQLLLDSHSRTIKGFQSLIQKEWIALGHPFSDRCVIELYIFRLKTVSFLTVNNIIL